MVAKARALHQLQFAAVATLIPEQCVETGPQPLPGLIWAVARRRGPGREDAIHSVIDAGRRSGLGFGSHLSLLCFGLCTVRLGILRGVGCVGAVFHCRGHVACSRISP